jgi:2OG-Fe(II) oxygenase superfamily
LNRQVSTIEDKHVDYNFPHLVLLYYVNTTDGDTILYDNNNEIAERISPKRGRCVLFDGLTLHASSSSTLAPRLVLNTNVL